MIIIGERINSTRTKVRQAIERRDEAHILGEAKRQAEAGAQYIDVNCAVTPHDESQDMVWAIGLIRSELPHVGISIDSPNPSVVEHALSALKGDGPVIINSITAERERLKVMLPLVRASRSKVVALTMDESGMPATVEDRTEIAKRILACAIEEGVPGSDILFDPLIRPVSTEPDQPAEFLRSLETIAQLGDVVTVCGLSNVSFGLPARSVMNTAFAAMAVAHGLGAAILDPLDRRLMATICAAEALSGRDAYCARYLKAFRAGQLEG